MKTLQNNFTTPEQSKRLLELGVSADSADCFYSCYIKTYSHSEYTEIIWIRPRFITDDNNPNWNARLMDGTQTYLPCWTVGRLIEICLKCSTLEQRQVRFFCNGDDDYYDFMAYTINILESGVITNHMDFSKLEE